MNYSRGMLQLLDAQTVSGLQIPALFSSCIALFSVLFVSAAVRLVFPRGPQLPIAFSDQIAERKKRIEQYSFDSRNMLIEGYTKVFVKPTIIKYTLTVSSSKDKSLELTPVKVPLPRL